MNKLIALLKQGQIDTFNDERPFTLDFFAEDLSGLNLQNVDFSGANLEKTDLSDSNLEGANLSKARLNGADLNNTNMNDCNLMRAKLDEIFAENSTFENAEMKQISFNEAEFHGCSFEGTNLTEAKGRNAHFVSCNLQGVDMSESRCTGLTLKDCKAEYGLFNGTRLAKSKIKECVFDDASLYKVLFAESQLENLSFSRSNLTQSNWNNATIKACSFDQSNLNYADLSGVDLSTLVLDTAQTHDIHTDLGQKPEINIPPAKHLFIETPLLTLYKNQLFCCWSNPETSGNTLRFIIYDIKKSNNVHVGSIPTNPSLLKGMRVIPTPKGFVLMCFELRPSGLYAIFYLISNKGKCSRFGQIPIPYSVDLSTRQFFSLFEIRFHTGFLELYILGRNTPRLHVHQLKFTGEFNHYAHDLPTALGLISGSSIHTITKGGSVCILSVRGRGDILQSPKGFPGRFFRCTTANDQLYSCWLAQGEQELPPKKGVFVGDFRDNGDVMRFHNRASIHSSDLLHNGKDIWLVSRVLNDFHESEIWVSQATGLIQYNLPEQDIIDEIDQFYVLSDNTQKKPSAVLALNLINGSIQLFNIAGKEPVSLGVVSQ